MRFLGLPIVLAIIFSLAGVAPAVDGKKDKKSGGKIERSMAADPNVTITLCPNKLSFDASTKPKIFPGRQTEST